MTSGSGAGASVAAEVGDGTVELVPEEAIRPIAKVQIIASRVIGFEPVIHTPKLLDLVRKDWRATRPLVEWAQRHGVN
jgi:hypothetical protein